MEDILHNHSVASSDTSAFLQPIQSFDSPTSISNYFQESNSENINFTSPQRPQYQQSSSNLSSVISSFSNYLKVGGNSNQNQENQENQSRPSPAGLDNFITSQVVDAPPVPLINIATTPLVKSSEFTEVPTPATGPVNSFRRTGLKRPTYAHIPGLTSNSNPPPPAALPTNPPNFLPPQQPTQLLPSVSPASSTSSIQEATFSLNNQFKPINPHPPYFPQVKPNIPFPQHSQNILQEQVGPVMSAIPPSEMFGQNDNFGSSLNEATVGNNPQTSKIYRPVYHHWFYNKESDGKASWIPFSMVDSLAIEHAFTSNDLDLDKVLATDGGRFDVNILRRQRIPVYWEGNVTEVRRCSWFHKNAGDRKYVPYEENIATKLEEEFKQAFESNQWHKEVDVGNGEKVVFHGPETLVLFPANQNVDTWTNTPNQTRPMVVKRGMDEFDIDEGEPATVDHLLFMVHGIGSVCDLKFRKVEEVVDEFRNIALQLVQSHYKSSCEQGVVNRVEVLPVSWHGKLHSEETGVDDKLKNITLESIPRLRAFTNDTILDVLFYTSPHFCQKIISTVGDELNRLYSLFKQRNPTFNGAVSLSGHSLGSLILFDLLSHQHPQEQTSVSDDLPKEDISEVNENPNEKKFCRRISYMMGSVGAGQIKILYPHLTFNPKAFFALGSPIGMFVTVRGLDTLVAYRIEALVNPKLAVLKPVLIPHHKGRKRMHLELKETMARVGADLKQKVFDSMKSTWNSFYQLAMFHKQDQPALENEVNKSIQTQLETTLEEEDQCEQEPVQEPTDIPLGQLNKGRRIDYVLQEAPFEFFNDYIFALTSHVCYWDSEDTILMILKEIYSSMDIQTDNKIPQQTMTIERPSPALKVRTPVGMDPTHPMSSKKNLPPPPTSGFVRKT
ncbi:hypothetical protein GWI33_007931 [Rhynchophorus ferrugineus]|uniref:Phospholipase DDHD2 n=1 Tax=Rhynchophorus ferrugineus TaxID=354439 RepID=A0A834MBI1_RHYFE|nr:hypothetical protein GWI33_007931 [Rhynchophorus ferrugineus]